MQLPDRGTPKETLLARMRERKAQDADWRGGRTWSLIYPAGEDVDDVLRAANELYLYENALNPFAFPSLREMESDVVEMAARLLNGDPEGDPAVGGTMTSGGTESILMAMKTARERARAERGVTEPELVAPRSAHPAFAKAAHYLGMKLVLTDLRDDLRADVTGVEAALTDNTAVVVGSAPNYPHGVVDPIGEMAALAAARGVSFHTDACLGGFLLPFYERLGRPVPPFDFRVPGVTSMSADVHKYGYCTKGASVVLHRPKSNLAYQVFAYGDWPGGLYGTFAAAGARPAAPVAAAWAVMTYLGEDGYLAKARMIVDAFDRIRGAIAEIPELHVWGEPDMSVMAFGSDALDVFAVGDVMDDRGWRLDRQDNPRALHLMVAPMHVHVVDEFVADLRDAVAHHGEARGGQARYGAAVADAAG